MRGAEDRVVRYCDLVTKGGITSGLVYGRMSTAQERRDVVRRRAAIRIAEPGGGDLCCQLDRAHTFGLGNASFSFCARPLVYRS
jgi:hypothetical protein